jgi:phage tail P2-like protein
MADVNSILPPNATPRERDLEQAGTGRIEQMRVDIFTLWNADTCPLALLPWLAWAMDVEQFDSSVWSEAQQRAAIAASYKQHNIAGTPQALRHALAQLGLTNITLREYGNQFWDGRYRWDGSITFSGHLPYQFSIESVDMKPDNVRFDGSYTFDGSIVWDGYTARYHQLIAAVLRAIAEAANARSHLRQLMYGHPTWDGGYVFNGAINFDGGVIYNA